MTRFVDGPAEDVRLVLQRSPVFLRVALGLEGRWDALDQIDDTPEPDENMYVYRLHGTPGVAFVDYPDRQGRRAGHRCMIAEYRYWPDQPEDSDMRTTEAWQLWCKTQKEREQASLYGPLGDSKT